MLRSSPRWDRVRSRIAALERWLLPGECLICRQSSGTLALDPLVCAVCANRWPALPELLCDRCGQPLSREISCRLCSGWDPRLRQVRSAVWLTEGARQAVHLLKYEGWSRIGETLAGVMRRRLRVAPGSTLIPIPLGPARLRSRGYNQSAVIARALAARLDVSYNEAVLHRRRDTRTQTALCPEERSANLAGAFLASGVPELPVLVDDVFTTGATLVEAASALLAAGAPAVSAVTFARAMRPLAGAAEATTNSNSWSTS